ncbi:MAG: VOC family protein [Ignavibacteriae bacterium]|nr:VOC family protein [Ignavibacteriota bacterium]
MEPRRNNTIAPSIRVRDMQKSLDFYTKTLGFQASDKLTRKDGRIVHASVGFDSPLLMLSLVEYVRTPQTKEDLAKNKLGIGVEFYIAINGSKKLDEFFTEVKAKGITVINEPKTEFWGDRIFTVRDPDGYALTFSEHVNDVTPEARTAAFETAHQK